MNFGITHMSKRKNILNKGERKVDMERERKREGESKREREKKMFPD